jgi:hypothetical protein
MTPQYNRHHQWAILKPGLSDLALLTAFFILDWLAGWQI